MAASQGTRTKAYVVDHAGGPFELREVVLDSIRDNEVLVEMLYTGLCHTDLVVRDGGMPVGGFPAVLGHEGLGVVRQVGRAVADASLTPGDTVILSFHSCRACRWCDEGQYGACPDVTKINFTTTARDGPGPAASHASPISLPDGTPVYGQFFGQSSLSKLAVVTEKSVIKIRDAATGPGGEQPADLAFLTPLACGYLTGAGTVLNVLKPAPTESVAVLGLGAVGMAAVMAARAAGVRNILAVDLVDAKLQTAADVGASHTVNTRAFRSLDAGIRSVFPAGVDKIVDATGVVSLLNDAVKALAHGGTLALVGVPPPGAMLQVDALDLLVSCKKIVGVIEGLGSPQKAIPELVQLYNEGKFPIDKLATVYPADKLDDALEDFKAGRAVKPILSWASIEQKDTVTASP